MSLFFNGKDSAVLTGLMGMIQLGQKLNLEEIKGIIVRVRKRDGNRAETKEK